MPDLGTAAPDSRFHSTNQANHCWNLYNKFALCLKQKDGDEDACSKQRRSAISLCPDEWVEKWDEEREEGNFAGIK